MAFDPAIRDHQEWLGLVQPVGVVVTPPALRKAQAFLPHSVVAQQDALEALATQPDGSLLAPDLVAVCTAVLNWQPADLVDTRGDASLEVALPEYGDTLRPHWGVPDTESGGWLILVSVVPAGSPFDDAAHAHDGWHASPQARLERLLREKNVPIGLLYDGAAIRLVYAPRGESSGHLTFRIAELLDVAGRPMLAALVMLLGADRLWTLPSAQRLPALLRDSRKYQNEVSTALAEQVLAALHELLRGFQSADEAAHGRILGDAVREDPQHVYGALLTVLLRLVFLLYAEDRGLMPQDETYARHYSVTGLFELLREDDGRWPDTMDQRYGAWARLLALFRLVYDGGGHGGLRLPPREGDLFAPDRFAFLEGRPFATNRVKGESIEAPRVSDGVVWRVLRNLLLLDGERLSYRALDVEQIGSVYEAMMGFALQVAPGRSVAVRPDHVVVDLDALLAAKPADRLARLDEAGAKMTGKAADQIKSAMSVEDLVAALGRKVSPTTPQPVAKGSLVLQPGDERRRSGSHYTPRSLTEPIVRKTLEPVLADLGPAPTPDQILALKVCDPAMGSGAFLVEACRQLGDALVAAWVRHDAMPKIPPDEDPLLHARRLVAQRCLYGVDKNPFAASLAKLSLWLVTLAKDHPFTFLDHALKHGDSLVGLTKAQIAAFHWDQEVAKRYEGLPLLAEVVRNVGLAASKRSELAAMGDDAETWRKREKLRDADEAVEQARARGDLVIAAFFAGAKEKERLAKRDAYNKLWNVDRADLSGTVGVEDIREEMRDGARPIVPFHWEIEFPEVFSRDNPGFDAFVGNPPFLGGKRISTVLNDNYRDWLPLVHVDSTSNVDLVAHFFRRSFTLVRPSGCAGLIATNTIAQGETRSSGLGWICRNGGTIFAAERRLPWPGQATVVISTVQFRKGPHTGVKTLDRSIVAEITAFLYSSGGNEEPARLDANSGKSFIGSYVLGMGFTFDDANPDATPITEMQRLCAADPRNSERVRPYYGGEDVNETPIPHARRWVIDFGDLPLEEAERWPDLLEIVKSRVKPERDKVKRDAHRLRWWQYADRRPGLYSALSGLNRTLVTTMHSHHLSIAFTASNIVFSHGLTVFPLESFAALSIIQSRPHESWARAFGSSLGDALRYTPSDCFETFPFPPAWEKDERLEAAGRAYYEFRAALMVRHDQGLTATYNRFHDPDERDPDLLRLRELHAAMDRAVLDAYGWTDLQPTCEFLLDYEEPEEEEDGKKRRKKKPWRYRWPDAFRDEVLARLLELNRVRAEQERMAQGTDGPKKPKKRKPEAV